MSHYLCKDKYRLELHWDSVEYHDDSTASLKGAYFSGPVLRIAQKVNSPDSINIDLTPQHFVVMRAYYILKLEWDQVDYSKDGKILLGAPRISNDQLKSLHKLENDDYLIIDTEDHEEATHAFHLVYEGQVIRKDKEPYKYGR